MTELATQTEVEHPPTLNQPDGESSGAAYALGAVVLGSLSLAACGGGGGSASSGGGGSVATLPPPTQPQAARFVGMAGLGATQADLDALTSKGYEAWLDAQFNAPRSLSHFDWLLSKGYGVEADRYQSAGLDANLWRKLLGSPDVLRQRVVLALSEIFVVSATGLNTAWAKFALAAYLDMLEERAFGTYRELLGAVSLSCAMGVYLNMRGNQKGDPKTGRQPDENYAREVMQLFSIGLLQLNPDGSPKTLADGRAQYTYNQEHVTALAQVFTGWDFNTTNVNASPAFMREPMRHVAARFATGDKSVLGVAIPASADGPAALNKALDVLADHPNVGPFIGRQLIQRLVCSNPSPAYVARVSAVFANNGRGQRGDLKAVIRAILLDPEAISPPAGPASGKLREPVLRFVQWAHTFGVASPSDAWAVGDTSNPSSRLGQSPLRSPSVFNFFRPGYLPPDSALGTNAVTAPEFQLCNETTVAGYLNFMQGVIQNGIGDLKPNYTAYLTLGNDASALVARFNLLLAGGRLGADTQSTIVSAVSTITATTDTGRLNRVRAAILLVMAAPEYLIQV